MRVIYEPRGKAREYSELACNIGTGCIHRCKYCYCPAIMHKTRDEWANSAHVRPGIVEAFAKDATTIRGDPREILLCFMCDPYQSDHHAAVMKQIMNIAAKNQLRLQILTKAGETARADFPILARNNWKFGTTACFVSERLREEWEPGAPSMESRFEAVREAHDLGIFTWVSIEPVIDTAEALRVMDELKGYVDLWKVGKLNHFPDIEKQIDWSRFLADAQKRLAGENVYYKKDLLRMAYNFVGAY